MNFPRTFHLEPHVGIGDVVFGMSRAEVQSRMGIPEDVSDAHWFEFNEFRIWIPARDVYFQAELQIHYDGNETVEFIEFYGHQAEYTQVFLGSIDVFGSPVPSLIQSIRGQFRTDFNHLEIELPHSYTFLELDIGFWRQDIPEMDEEREPVPEDDPGKYFWSLGIGVKGYFSRG